MKLRLKIKNVAEVAGVEYKGDERQLSPIKLIVRNRIKNRKAKKLSFRAKRKLRNKRAAQARKLNCK